MLEDALTLSMLYFVLNTLNSQGFKSSLSQITKETKPLLYFAFLFSSCCRYVCSQHTCQPKNKNKDKVGKDH